MKFETMNSGMNFAEKKDRPKLWGGRTGSPVPRVPPSDDTEKPPSQKIGILSHMARHDRSGAALSNMLLVKALAEAYGMEYSGVYPDNGTENSSSELLKLMGLPRPMKELPSGTVIVNDLTEFMAKVKQEPNRSYHINYEKVKSQVGLVLERMSKVTLFDNPTRSVLMRHANLPKPTLWEREDVLHIAVHIRRGDVLVGDIGRGLAPNAWYLALMDEIRKSAPLAEFVIFSSNPFGDMEGYMLSDFVQEHVITRLDGSLVEAWSHMAQADIFIASDSAFSKPPAIMNKHLVITKKTFGFEGIGSWLDTDGTMLELRSMSFKERLSEKINMYAMKGVEERIKGVGQKRSAKKVI